MQASGAVKVRRRVQEKDGDDMSQLRRIGLTLYVRVTIPKDRWADFDGRREVVRTLQTTDLKIARQRKDGAIRAIRETLEAQLRAKGVPPLGDGWSPSWEDEALAAREEVLRASDEPYEDPDMADMAGSPRAVMKGHIYNRAEELADSLPPAAVRQFIEVATAETIPIRQTADRWLRDIEGTIRKQTSQQNGRSLDLLGEFLRAPTGRLGDVLATTGMEKITRRLAGEFVEWLQHEKGLNPKTVASRVSALSSLWRWADRKGIVEGTPWTGQTTGLKKKATALKAPVDDERAYEAGEIVALLRADPNAGRRWTYGAAIFDLMRLGLLTGARQNELASLTMGDLMPDQEGIIIRAAKTASGIRAVPLHPLAQEVIRARVLALPTTEDKEALLFPELSPGGPDGKRSWHFSSKFTAFRVSVLGENPALDFHSLRRTFSTYLAVARANGTSEASQDIQDDLMGHKRQALSGNTYTAKDLGWHLKVKAIHGMVARGMPTGVLEALAETAGARPPLPKRIVIVRRVRSR